MKQWIAALTAALAAAACSDGAGGTGASASSEEIVGVTWRLVGLAPSGGVFAAPPAGTFTLELREDGALAAVADCNRCGGDYALGQGTLVVEGGVLACTRAACPSAPFDTDYARSLAAVRTWEGDASALTLAGDEGRLRFERSGS